MKLKSLKDLQTIQQKLVEQQKVGRRAIDDLMAPLEQCLDQAERLFLVVVDGDSHRTTIPIPPHDSAGSAKRFMVR